jgi:hypothetical protein
MTMVEYLQSVRTTTQEDVDRVVSQQDLADNDPETLFEAHQHHQEYAPASH